jgi:hypothetical protein
LTASFWLRGTPSWWTTYTTLSTLGGKETTVLLGLITYL